MARPRLYLRVLDVLMAPLLAGPLVMLRFFRRKGAARMPLVRALCRRVGVFPIRNHYYDPYVDPAQLRRSLGAARELPGIELNDAEQLQLLAALDYQEELQAIPHERRARDQYHFANGTFGPGDGEYLYALLRHLKPRRVVEVGSGLSTLLARQALRRNRAEDPEYACEHVCVEPYEKPFFDSDEIRLLRSKSEDTPLSLFEGLGANDVLLLDTTHVIRPQGDVVHAIQRILPALAAGVYVHVHDIFTPFDYPERWVVEDVRMWDEQYLLEAFLAFNPRFRVVGALHYLARNYPDELHARCPALRALGGDPSSFWIVAQGAPDGRDQPSSARR